MDAITAAGSNAVAIRRKKIASAANAAGSVIPNAGPAFTAVSNGSQPKSSSGASPPYQSSIQFPTENRPPPQVSDFCLEKGYRRMFFFYWLK